MNDFENQNPESGGLPKGKEGSPHHSYRCWGKSQPAYVQEVPVSREGNLLLSYLQLYQQVGTG